MFFKCVVLVINIAILLLLKGINSEVVETENGPVEGTIIQTWTGKEVHAFYGIPYAEPPINELRFEPPFPVTSWNETHNATEYGSICMQFVSFNHSFVMSEDCLKLNIFTRNLPSENATELKPVIVFFHGGGLERGSANQNRPNYIMDRDVVFVGINYRLAAFGFLATGTKEAPGNLGLKDQVMALKWIHTNIRHFGGSPDKITLAGLSAGGYSIIALMASPMAVNLFQGIISLSGAITWQMGLANHHLDTAISLGRQLDCIDERPEELVACLKTKSAADIVRIDLSELPYCGIMKWLPVVEPDFGQERLLVEDPNESFRNGRFHRAPVIAGITEVEFANPVPSALEPENVKLWNDNFPEMLSHCCFYSNGKNIQKVGNILRQAYLPFDTIDVRSFNSLGRLFADGIIGIGVHRFVHFASRFTDVYYYKFTYSGHNSLFYYPRDRPYGVHHVDDLQYVIYLDFMTPLYSPDDTESLIVERMTRIWEQFAWNGNPNNETDEYLSEMIWPKHDTENEYYLDIGLHFVEKNGLFLERYSVWDRLDTDSASTLTLSFLVGLTTFVVYFIKIVFV